MKKILVIALAAMLLVPMAVQAQEEPTIKDFTQIELGVLLTLPNNGLLDQEQKIAVVPSIMLKQKLFLSAFTLLALETNLGTSVNDTTAFKFGFGYALPEISLFSYNGVPITMQFDLILAKDLVTNWDENAVGGIGVKFDRSKTNNFALIARVFWNHVKVEDTWEDVWTFVAAGEFGVM